MKAIMVEQSTTRDLVARARGGDRAAFDLLVERFRARLRDSVQGWGRFRLGPRLETEDVLQETSIRAFRSIARFEWDGEDSFLRWLCGIAKRVVADAGQKAAREARRTASHLSASGLAAADSTPSQKIRRDERFDRLQRSVDGLRAEHREVLVLSCIEGLTMAEIAARTGRSPSTVKYFLACALAELKRQFGNTESLHLPDRQLDTREPGDDR